MWFDAGVNLTHSRLIKRLDKVLDKARQAHVDGMLVIATNEAESAAALELCEQYPDRLRTTVGIHPHDADNVSSNYLDKLEQWARHPAVVAIGECGLDFNRNFSSRQQQLTVFAEQVQLANRCDLPLYLHERDAQDDQLTLLNQHCADHTPCLTHCFTGGPEQARAYIRRGHWFGITGWLCDERRNQELLKALPELSPDRVLLETDAPFLQPRGIRPRPKMNEPALLPYIGEMLAQHWQCSVNQVAETTMSNARRLFQWSPRETL